MKSLLWGLAVVLTLSLASNGWLWVKAEKADRKRVAAMTLMDSLCESAQNNSGAQEAVIADLVGERMAMGKAGVKLVEDNVALAGKCQELQTAYDELFARYGELLYASQDVLDHNKSLVERLRNEYAARRELTKAAAFNRSLEDYSKSADIVRELQGIRWELQSANIWK